MFFNKGTNFGLDQFKIDSCLVQQIRKFIEVKKKKLIIIHSKLKIAESCNERNEKSCLFIHSPPDGLFLIRLERLTGVIISSSLSPCEYKTSVKMMQNM